MIGRSVPEEKYVQLLEWLRANDAEINDKLELRASLQGDGYGAFITSPVEKDELLFTIPRKVCLTLQDATNDKDCGETFQKLIDVAGPGGNTVSMAGYMAKEYLLSQEENLDSFWKPYFQTLPWQRGKYCSVPAQKKSGYLAPITLMVRTFFVFCLLNCFATLLCYTTTLPQ
jgi:hypothetical protein